MSPYDTSIVWEQVKKHFKIETRYDLLDHCYAKFDKAFFASLCVSLSETAQKGDALSLHLFEEAGRYLAKATAALLPHVSDKLLTKGNLNVVCVGSVWKSWKLLQDGFTNEIAKSTNHKFGLNLITLTQATAIGAAYLGVDSINYKLPRDYSHNYDIFHHFPSTVFAKTNGTTNGVGTKQTNGNVSNGSTNGKLNGTSNRLTNGNKNGTNIPSNGVNGKHTNGTKAKKGMKSCDNNSPNAIIVQDG